MRVVRLYDRSRQPTDWMDLIQPGEVAAFPSLPAAERYCDAQVERHPAVRFDVFDHAGRSRPPLLTIVHPSHRARLEGNAGVRRRNRWIVVALVTTAAWLFWYEWYSDAALIGLPTLFALNALVFAGRLLQLNAAYAGVERARLARQQAHAAAHPATSNASRP